MEQTGCKIRDIGELPVETKNPLYRLKAPCGKCPYKLGLVHAIVNPCPQCKADHYRTYKRFIAYGTKARKPDEP